MKASHEMYDQLAPYYRKYSSRKKEYIKSVDNLILRNAPKKPLKLLDIGAGDGVRGMHLAKQMGVKSVVLSDPSKEMVERCRSLKPSAIWYLAAENLPNKHIVFDVILCLWNVLGHVQSEEKRLIALKKIKNLLTDNGLLFIDVNNRYNISNYGILNVIKNMMIDILQPTHVHGDVRYSWHVGKKKISAKGHLFSPREIEDLIKKSGLKIKIRYAVNYASGSISFSQFHGQLLYILKK